MTDGVARRCRNLVLASASPRRSLLLRQIGLTFAVVPAEVDEQALFDRVATEGELDSSAAPSAPVPAGLALPARQVCEAAIAKARAAARSLSESPSAPCDPLIIAADTIVLLDGQVLGKPGGVDDARRMLRLLSGRTHEVLTGVAVLDPVTGRSTVDVEMSCVSFDQLAEPWIDRYVATGEPMDKAGAYAVQGLGSVFIRQVSGCYFNVVGLPLSLLARLLREHGYEVVTAW